MPILSTPVQRLKIEGTAGDWVRTGTFAEYDPSLGVLTGARFTLDGTIDASIAIENLSPAPATVTLAFAALITATAPIGVVGVVAPSVAMTLSLGAYDGTLDNAGDSGTVVADLPASQTQETVFTPDATGTVLLSGGGSFDVTVSSTATSTVYGNGNLSTVLHASTGAVVTVGFTHQAPSDGSGAGAMRSAGGLTGSFDALNVLLATTAPQSVVFPSRTSGWTGNAIFNRFNPVLGTLLAVDVTVTNTLAGGFSAENLAHGASRVTMSETATVSVDTRPGTAEATASGGDTLTLAGFDGAADFSGPSGRTDAIAGSPGRDTGGSASRWGSFDPSFIGTGTIALPVTSAGQSVVTGPSDLYTVLTQQTGATVSVSYEYAPANGGSIVAFGGDVAANHPSSAGGGPTALAGDTPVLSVAAPSLAFIGGSGAAITAVAAISDETFRIGVGANAAIANFSIAAGNRLDLTDLLGGWTLAHDMSDIGYYVRVTGHTTHPGGGTDTTLSVGGLFGTASLSLLNAGSIEVPDLLGAGALILPAH